jgi:hypothetical protein
MQTINVNGIEIQFDGLELTIEENGKRIIVRGKPATEVLRFIPYPIYPQPFTYPQPIWQPPIGPTYGTVTLEPFNTSNVAVVQ